MALVPLTLPGNTPVSLDEAKAHCRIVSSDATHDARLIELINDAVSDIETKTGAKLDNQMVRLDLDGFPCGSYSRIDLGVYPVNSIVSVKYDDSDNDEQTLVLNTDYWVNLGGMYPYIQAVSSWPATMYAKPACVRITMDVGYYSGSPVTTACPNDLRRAVLLRIQEWFEHTGESVTGQTVTPTISSVKALTDMHRRIVV